MPFVGESVGIAEAARGCLDSTGESIWLVHPSRTKYDLVFLEIRQYLCSRIMGSQLYCILIMELQ